MRFLTLLVIAVLAAAPAIKLAAEESGNVSEPTSEVTGAVEPTTEAEVYGLGVRSTPWLEPRGELAKMHLPPGFEIRLFASEPQIAKPLNMAFDARGRMWVTQSVEYPYPAKEGAKGRDAVMILEDRDGDGEADTFKTFADGLNVPIGILPYGDGCLCFSIPNVWYLRDTDGDDVCDQREIVLGPFDTTRDTHGMINSLRDGGDGWIYACHGFNNQSEVSGSDGHTIKMSSGNTFRFRPDGSRVEHITHGQVNPFGMTEDQWGYRYTADCHSKPITQLIRGACYPSFSKPHDGLGFLPPMMEHLHGSTAICGLVCFPPDSPFRSLRGQMISGNVMTSRINRTGVSYRGATAVGEPLPDLLTCDDPWFRPVDIRVGHDGHLYVADFYNKIIGHYEVPLDHPERDRTSGRIWQIRCLDRAVIPPRIDDLDDCYRVANDSGATVAARCGALKQIGARGELTEELLVPLLRDESAIVRVAATGLASELIGRDPGSDVAGRLKAFARASLEDANPHVARSSAELLGLHGTDAYIPKLLACLEQVPSDDSVLRQTCRIAIRDLLLNADEGSDGWAAVSNSGFAGILLGLQRPEAADALLNYLEQNPEARARDAMLSHVAKHASDRTLARCVAHARKMTRGDTERQFELLNLLVGTRSSSKLPASLRSWGLDLVDSQLAEVDPEDRMVSWTADEGPSWEPERRKLRGAGEAMLWSSLSRGEKYTGRWVSDPFQSPNRIRFRVAGHNGFPDQPDHGKNRIRLVSERDGRVLHEVTPPRNDAAIQVDWDTSALNGEKVCIECLDGDAGRAYAWIAIGEFEPSWIGRSSSEQSLRTALNWIQRLGLTERLDSLNAMLPGSLSARLRLEIARVISRLQKRPEHAVVTEFLLSIDATGSLADGIVRSVRDDDDEALFSDTLKELCKRMSASQQASFAEAWAKNGGGVSRLIEITESGWISPGVFVDADVQQVLDPRLSPEQRKRVGELASRVEVGEAKLARLSELTASLKDHAVDKTAGQALFAKHCAACHQLRGAGVVVGPQLDGAASRSLERLLEDIVTPDRNVDRAFRTTSFLLDDGRVIIGLVTVESPSEIRVVESDGKIRSIDPELVELRREAGRSLMPSNMSEALTAEQLGDLIGFVRGS
ncbi:MAG: PVC-type heme-binding CxxCH protein [Rubripirellula sp.]